MCSAVYGTFRFKPLQSLIRQEQGAVPTSDFLFVTLKCYGMKLNKRGLRPLFCTYRLNWASLLGYCVIICREPLGQC